MNTKKGSKSILKKRIKLIKLKINIEKMKNAENSMKYYNSKI